MAHKMLFLIAGGMLQSVSFSKLVMFVSEDRGLH